MITKKPLADLPESETARCRLAPLRIEDAAELQALTDDPVITEAVIILPTPFTPADAEALIRAQDSGAALYLGVRDRTAGALAGVVGVHRHQDAVEVGYWIGAAFRGRGYATEAVRGLVDLLAQRFPRQAIFAECRPENRASWNVLTKTGFRPTGLTGARPGRQVLRLETPSPS